MYTIQKKLWKNLKVFRKNRDFLKIFQKSQKNQEEISKKKFEKNLQNWVKYWKNPSKK